MVKVQQVMKYAILAAMVTAYNVAFAAAPRFASGGAELKNDLIVILTPFFGIGIIALGALAWFGKIHWMWCASACFGAVMVFANEQIIQWLRALFT